MQHKKHKMTRINNFKNKTQKYIDKKWLENNIKIQAITNIQDK